MKCEHIKNKSVNLATKRQLKRIKLLRLLSEYLTYKQITKITKMKKSAISMAFKRFREYNWINKDRTLTSEGILQIKKCEHMGLSKTVNKEVRGHNFVFTLSIPEIKNWNKRRNYLEDKKISYKKLPYMKSESIIIDKRKIWLTPKSIVFYMNASYFEDNAYLSNREAVKDLMQLIYKLEKKLNQSLKYQNGYKIRVSRQHYALVKNELAKLYNEQGKKLYVRDETGLWLIVDDSLPNLFGNELETVHNKTAPDDNMTVKDFMNDLKKNPITFSDVLNMIQDVTANQVIFDKNMSSHIEAVKSLSKGVKELRKEIKKINKNP